MDVSNPRSLHNREELGAILITGAGSGIGAATAHWLSDRKQLVFAGVRSHEQQQSLSADPSRSANLVYLQLDVTDEASIENARRIVEKTLEQRGLKLSGLVNNAADESLGPVEVLPLEVFRHEITVGYLGTVAVCKAMLPLLRESSGRIVNISSVNGRCTFKYHATTCATKYAVEAFSDALRMELKPWRIHVAIVEPGPTDTPLMVEKTVAEFTEKLARYSPDELARYFPDYGSTIEHVKQFVDRIKRPPKNKIAKFKRLLNGQGWLHSPQDVARVIEHALHSRRPKTRYLIGTQAKLIYLARRLMSDRRFDRFLGEKVFDF